MSDRQGEELRVLAQSPFRVELGHNSVTLAIEPAEGQVQTLVFDGEVLLGQVMIAPDAVEVIQAGRASGTLIEWET